MGRMTEYIAFLKVSPSELTEFKQNLSHITINDDMMKERSKLKLYKDK
jgi:hypothetical protein